MLFLMAMLKPIVDFCTLLIGAEGANPAKNAFAFPSCDVFSRMLIQILAGEACQKETPLA